MDCKKLMLCFGRIVTVALLFGCLIELSHGQPKPTEKGRYRCINRLIILTNITSCLQLVTNF